MAGDAAGELAHSTHIKLLDFNGVNLLPLLQLALRLGEGLLLLLPVGLLAAQTHSHGCQCTYTPVNQARGGRHSPEILLVKKPLLVADDREILFVLLQRYDQLPVLLLLVSELLCQQRRTGN